MFNIWLSLFFVWVTIVELINFFFGVWDSNTELCIYYVLSLSIELNS